MITIQHNPLLGQITITMKKILLLGVIIMLSHPTQAQQQETNAAVTPKNKFEVGIHGGMPFVGGEINPGLGYGVGLSVRKAVDYLFSFRADFFYGQLQGERIVPMRDHTTKYMSFTGLGILTLNAMRFDKPVRKTNLYFLAGAGLNDFSVEYNSETTRMGSVGNEMAAHVTVGAGFAFRINSKINIGIEHQSALILGTRADLLDGIQFNEQGQKSSFGDSFNYTSLRINFNIGGSGTTSEPLFWLNPIQIVLDDLNQMKSRPAMDIIDSDDDGVIDALDKEPDTPEDAIVDTKGRTLDSDRDGVADHLDKQPYYTPMPGERINSEGIVENPIAAVGSAGGSVSEDRVRELINEALAQYKAENPVAGSGNYSTGGSTSAPGTNTGNNTRITSQTNYELTNMFLPMIHFAAGSATIRYSDYGSLAGIARVLKGNPEMKMAIIGHADKTGNQAQNELLSFERANAVVEYMVNNHGIDRGRLVLLWKGEEEALVPLRGSYMNRRVEFRVAAPDDIEMDPPTSTDNGTTGY